MESEKIPADFSGFRVAYLSDQHGESPGKAGERAEKLIEECRADLVLIGGDMMTVHRNEPYNPEPFSRLLRAIPSGTAREIASHYKAIFVDEYQDTNLVQETLINTLLEAGQARLFAVGDVKQGIYRFRQAEPGLFMDKYARYPLAEGGEEHVSVF